MMGKLEKRLQDRYGVLCAELGDCTLRRDELDQRIAEIRAAVREVNRGVEQARKDDAAEAGEITP